MVAWTVWGIYAYRKLKLALREGDREALILEYRLTIAGEVVGGVLKRVEGLVGGPRPVYSETGSSFQRGQSDKESQHG